MHYALYRKYRPKTFGEVIGQDHVTKTLRAQIKSGQFSHSYLFTGTRGTGKTSCAKILARAVNCLSPVDGEPCNECEVCKGLLSGEIFDVVEMDAASNNSVDNIRQIRDEIMFTPMKAKYKVYIIDEVHMLSAGAFNALLKTLEEPPEHVIFILATTEAHKIPATILSRCQRFDMHRLSLQTIAAHLREIAAKEGRTFPDDIIYTVASLADGSVRDSLSILDKVMETEDPYMIKAALGVCDSDLLFSLSEAVASSDVDSLYSAVSDFYTASKDFSVLIHGLLEHFRLLLTAGTSKTPERFIEKSEEDIKRYKTQAPLFGVDQLLYILDTLSSTLSNLSRSPDKRAETEICLLKCARPDLEKTPSPLAARLSKIENALRNGNFAAAQTPVSVRKKEEPKTEVKAEPKPETNPEPKPEVKETADKDREKSVKKDEPTPAKNAEAPVKKAAMAPITDDFSEPEEPVKKAETPASHDSEYREFLSFKTLAAYVSRKDMFLGRALSRSCEAVYKDRDLIILCRNEKDRDNVSQPESKTLREEGLREDCKADYRVRFEIGAKENYLSQNQQEISDLYDHLEDSNLFTF